MTAATRAFAGAWLGLVCGCEVAHPPPQSGQTEGAGIGFGGSNSDPTDTESTAPGGSDGSDSEGAAGADVEKFDVLGGGTGPSVDECDGGGGELAFSYIWIANSLEGTVSKIDTTDGTELGRYFASPAEGAADPSRTSVNLAGDVVVAVRAPGGVTKIAARTDHCVDANADGTIQTSSGAGDVLPWGSDECVLWHTPLPSVDAFHGPRPTAWDARVTVDPDSGCTASEARAWTGYLHEDGHSVFVRLDGDSGEILDQVEGPMFTNRPYGGAVDGDGNFFVIGWNDDPALMIDGETLEITDLGNPGYGFYGLALDADGDLWIGDRSAAGAVVHYDRATQTWSSTGGLGGLLRGIMVDEEGQAWGAGNQPCRLVQVDTATETIVDAAIPLPGCQTPVGVSLDAEGFVWVVDRDAELAYKVDPHTHEIVHTVTGLVGPYTYSDMTGSGLKLVTGNPAG